MNITYRQEYLHVIYHVPLRHATCRYRDTPRWRPLPRREIARHTIVVGWQWRYYIESRKLMGC